jgi:hypothetical protein
MLRLGSAVLQEVSCHGLRQRDSAAAVRCLWLADLPPSALQYHQTLLNGDFSFIEVAVLPPKRLDLSWAHSGCEREREDQAALVPARLNLKACRLFRCQHARFSTRFRWDTDTIGRIPRQYFPFHSLPKRVL